MHNAFLDNGSSATFCTENLMRTLNAKVRWTLPLSSTMGNTTKRICSNVISSLEICDLNGNNVILLPNVYAQREMPITLDFYSGRY